MPKNMGKGGKNRKRGTNKNEPQKRELTTKEEGQDYAQVTKNLGNNRLELELPDGTRKIGVIRGAIRRKMWIGMFDVVLVGIRDFEEGKVDILSRYTPDETKQLIKAGEIPEHMGSTGGHADGSAEHGNVIFEAASSDEDGSDSEEEMQQNSRNIAALLAQPADDDDEEGGVNIDNI
jgi:translation initiation factor 1A